MKTEESERFYLKYFLFIDFFSFNNRQTCLCADEIVARFLIDASNGCLGMLVAGILPIQINEENEYFTEVRSQFWRRQELCLVTLSNVVIHRNVFKKNSWMKFSNLSFCKFIK